MSTPRHARRLKRAYKECIKIAQSHYENFPVASIVLPHHTRKAVAAIYVFARRADDIADEGNVTAEERQQQLQQMARDIKDTAANTPPDDPLYVALSDVIQRYGTPLQLYLDLLSAFEQDTVKNRYQNFPEVMDYCRRSANPVGRLLLYLFNQADEKNLALSDGICSALQLINFYQDINQDLDEMNRIYLPQDEMQRFGITEEHLKSMDSGPAMQALMQLQYQRTEKLLRAGAWLGKRLKGRAGFEIRLIIAAGFKVLEKLYQQQDLYSRPRLNIKDYGWILWRAIRKK